MPGLLALWAWLTVAIADRRKLGVSVTGLTKQLWENKLWLLAAAGLSLVAAYAAAWMSAADVLDAPAPRDVLIVGIVTAAITPVASLARVRLYRRTRPPSSTSAPDASRC